MDEDIFFMGEALLEAEIARALGEMPVGAVIARAGRVLSRGHNLRETQNDPTAHAEILAIREAARVLGDWRLTDCALYVTLEPCPMCAGAIVQARLGRLVYGARDPGAGCAGSVYRITEDPAFNAFTPADGGVLEAPCQALLRAFFKGLRG